MKSIEWWRSTANHMWRTYFALERDGFQWDKLPDPNRKIYAVCNHLFLKKFPATDQDILRMYFTSRWGDDRYAVEDYSARTGTQTTVIWMVIRRANKIVMQEIGLLPKEDTNDE